MTALRSCERQSAGYFPTTQTPSEQEFEKLFGGIPFRSPGFLPVAGATLVSRASIKTY